MYQESEDEDEERKEEGKEGEESKKPEQQGPSGANSKGNTTPSGKHRAEAAKKGKLKRPGSPNMSDSSDNEAIRKKLKTGKGSVVPSRGGTPIPGRPKPLGAGPAMSDGEATAGETSDAGGLLKKKLKVKPGVRPGSTPSGSRAGSPAPSGMFHTLPIPISPRNLLTLHAP